MYFTFPILLLFLSQNTTCYNYGRWRSYLAKCRSVHKASNYEIDGVMRGITPSTFTGKCFQGCMMEAMKWIDNGYFKKEKALRCAEEQLANNFEDLRCARIAFNNCSNYVMPVESHSLAPKVVQCVRHYCPNGLPLPLLGFSTVISTSTTSGSSSAVRTKGTTKVNPVSTSTRSSSTKCNHRQ